MTRLLWFSDPHTSTEPPPGRTTTPFYEVLFLKLTKLVKDWRPHLLLCGGDLFHSRAKGRPNPSLQHVLAIRSFIQELGVPWAIIPGNHDLAFDSVEHLDKSPLVLLEEAHDGRVRFNVLDEIGSQKHRFPWLHTVPFLGDDVEPPGSVGAKVVALHAPYFNSPDTFFNTLDMSRLQWLYPQASLILCGHIHTPFWVQTKNKVGGTLDIVNCGPLVRRTIDELDQPNQLLNWEKLPAAVLVDMEDSGEVRWYPVAAPPVEDLVTEVTSSRKKLDLHAVLTQTSVSYSPITDETIEEDLQAYLQRLPNGSEVSASAIQAAVAAFRSVGSV